jgi:hypothetical protein
LSRLVLAIQLATVAHAGQTDKCGQPFIGHPLRVMARGQTESEMIVGVLHDVLEDTATTFQELYFALDGNRWGLTNEEAFAVAAITRNKGEKYRDYIKRVAANPLAKQVKRYDLLDNADPRRGWAETPLSRYREAWKFLFPDEPLPRELDRLQTSAQVD